MSLLHLLEPEETIGNLWHGLVGTGSSISHYPKARVTYGEVIGPLRTFYRGLGGEPGTEIKCAAPEVSHHRLSRHLRLGRRSETVARARFNRERFSLPDAIDIYPERGLNERLYFWLAAWTAVGGDDPPKTCDDPMRQDEARIAHAGKATAEVLLRFPGLGKTYDALLKATLAERPARVLPPAEARIEERIRAQLTTPSVTNPSGRGLDHGGRDGIALEAPSGYRTYLPVPLWGEIEELQSAGRTEASEEDAGPGRQAGGDGKVRRARRRASDQINRKGGFFVHRFEKILSWTEFMNLHRNVEDDEEASAKKAADDHDEIGIGRLEKKAATRLAIDLDLAPADVDAERISAAFTYPEWDYRREAYLPDHVRVLERPADEGEGQSQWLPGPETARRIRAVRRQFEALRPRREMLGRQLDGHELDMDALIRSTADLRAYGAGSDSIFRQAREQARDLSVCVLIDVSRSTESYIEDRHVIDIAREALVALAEGLDACGDESAIYAFSSLRRDRVFVSRLKAFEEKTGPALRARIANLKPGFYTRLGAAIRHTGAALQQRPSRKRLLLVITDGKPNDLDHYEGRFGIEDTRKAIQEARRNGQTVFGITIDSRAQNYFPHMFGTGGFAILSHPSRLTKALPILYRHLVT